MKQRLLIAAILMVVITFATKVVAQTQNYDFSAVAPTGQTLYYKITDNSTVSVTHPDMDYWDGWDGYTEPIGSLTLPDTVLYNGIQYTVDSIGVYTFNQCRGLTSVVISGTVKSIGDCAFAGCIGLTSVTIGERVTYIDYNAFLNCDGLTSITIPNSVTFIGRNAFGSCDGLTSIVVASGNTRYDSRNDCNAIIETSTNTLIQGCASTIIPNSVTSIAGGAFGGQIGLTSVTIPNSVTAIGDYAFCDCIGLTSVTLSNSVTYIGYYAFRDCIGLDSVTIPNSVTSIDYCAFSGCRGLTSVTIPNSVTSIGFQPFTGCSGLTSIVVASGNTRYDSRNDCNAIIETFTNTLIQGCSSTIIPNSVISIDYGAFMGSVGLTSVTIPNSVRYIRQNAFLGCSGLTSVLSLSAMPPTLGDDAFRGVSDTIPIYVPCGSGSAYRSTDGWNRFNNIYDNSISFSQICSTGQQLRYAVCDSVSANVVGYDSICNGRLVIPDSVSYNGETYPVVSIGTGAFYNCHGLTSVVTGDSITTISDYAFYQCDSLLSVTIGNSVVTIGDNAFYNCASLASVTIGNAVTSIGNNAFYSCRSLSSIIIPNSVTTIGNYAFDYCNSLRSLTIGSSVTSIGNYAFYKNNGYIDSITSLASVPPTLGNNVFNPNYTYYTQVLIPCGTGAAYRSANGWWNFSNIEENGVSFSVACSTGQQLRYVSCDSVGATVVGYEGYCSGQLVIPDSVSYNGTTYPVTSIGGYAFQNCYNLTSVTIGNSVTSIGDYAFRYCNRIYGTLTIPSTVLSIGINPFAGCSNISSIVVENGNSVYDSRDNCNAIILTATNELVAGIRNTTIPGTVTSIGNSAFYQCNNIASDIVPGSVTSIGEYAFYNCNGVTSITIPSNVTSIGNNAFSSCNNLVSVTSLATVPPTLGDNVFSNYSMSVNVPCGAEAAYRAAAGWGNFGSIQGYSNEFSQTCSTGQQLRYMIRCDATCAVVGYEGTCSGRLVIPDSVSYNGTIYPVVSIGDYAFRSCNDLTSVTIGSPVTSIGDYAFQGCGSIADTLVIPGNVHSIGINPFSGCGILPAIVVSSGNSVYDSRDNCNAIVRTATNELVVGTRNTAIPNTVTAIGDYAFHNCYNLASITIPNSVAVIGYYAFYNCNRLTSVTIGNSVDTIRNNAFYCNNLASITSLAAVPPILDGYNVFYNYNSSTVNVPCGLEATYRSANGWWNFSDIQGYAVMFSDVCSTGQRLRYSLDCDSVCSVVGYEGTCGEDLAIPSTVTYNGHTYTVTNIGGSAFYNCYELTSVAIGDSITAIGSSAFYNCYNLRTVTIPNNVTFIDNQAFYYCSGLRSVSIGSSVDTISYNAFGSCYNLSSIISLATVPPTLLGGSNVFYNNGNTAVSVPCGTEATYRATYGWSNFNNIQGLGASFSHVCSTGQQLRYIVGCDSVCTLVGYDGTCRGTLVIPDSVSYNGNTYRVASIGYQAFYNCRGLASVAIGNFVDTIGGYAFAYCDSLTSVTIGSSAAYIGDYAFYSYNGYLSSITSLATVPPILGGSNVFYYNSYYNTSVNVPCGTEAAYRAANGWSSFNNIREAIAVFNHVSDNGQQLRCMINCDSICGIIGYDRIYNGQLTIPDSVSYNGMAYPIAYISDYAFYNCYTLTSIISLATVPPTFGGGDAFYYYNYYYTPVRVPCGLDSVYRVANGWSSFYNIQEGVTSFSQTCSTGQMLRYIINCDSTCTVVGYDGICSGQLVIPDSVSYDGTTYFVTSIGNSAFSYSNDLTSIDIPGTIISIGERAFEGCSGLISLTIPNSIVTIGNYAFSYCTGLTSVAFNADSCIQAGETNVVNVYIFMGCNNITNFTFGDNVKNIPVRLCKGLSSLTSVTIPRLVKYIGNEAFMDCTGITSVVFNADSCIGAWSFQGCDSISSFVFGNNIKRIPGGICGGLSGLTSITLPTTVTSIGSSAFYDCNGITSITIPYQVTSIEYCTFYGCSGLTSITIPGQVTSIDVAAFGNCTGLTSITTNATIPPSTYVGSSFRGVSSTIPIYVPCGSLATYRNSYYWRDFSNIEGIPGTAEHSDTTVTANGSYTWHGTQYTASGVYVYSDTNGCVSDTLHLTINYSTGSSESQTACDSYTWHGITYTASGTYTDGTDTLHLTINHGRAYTQVACDSFTWHTTSYGAPTGAINGQFSVGENSQVYISQGNLQYQASTGTWRFATNQWDCIGSQSQQYGSMNGNVTGSDNASISSSYSGWIDMFGWGTSGWNSGANCYQPWSTSTSYTYYYPGGSSTNNLTGSYANADWGVYNAISNGGNAAGLWRTLTHDEWSYLFYSRTGCSTVGGTSNGRYALAQVNGVGGVIVFPDSYTHPSGVAAPQNVNNDFPSQSWGNNSYSASDWGSMQTAGAVFLPAAGDRNGTSVCNVGSGGNYWSSSYYNSYDAWSVLFVSGGLLTEVSGYRYYGFSVRLVRGYNSNETSDTYNSSGTYYHSYTAANGCASVDTLHLTIHSSTAYTDVKTACDSYTWSDGNGHTYIASNSTDTVHRINAAGCDSVVTLNLTVNHSTIGTETVTACNSFTWHGRTFTTSTDTATYTTTNAAGCDSIVTLDLTVNYSTDTAYTQIACDSFTWHPTSYGAPTGAINGQFSVGENSQVYISQGNLQYQASTGTWRFSTNQYDCIGNSNSSVSSSYSGWIDLFGWGTSGWDNGNVYYQPYISADYSSSNFGEYYGPRGSYNLTGSYANADWGVYNAISNGGNAAGLWRTLTHEEWAYLFNTRTSASSKWGHAKVANVNGVIVLPDSFTDPMLNNGSGAFSSSHSSWEDNVYSASDWSSMQTAGAVFLPAAGYRLGTSVNDVGSGGIYWSSSYYGSYDAWYVGFSSGGLITASNSDRYYGFSVRLVRGYNSNETSDTYNSAGTYYHSYTAANGCASVDTLYLTINNNCNGNSETRTECDSYTWHDSTYTVSGTYYYNDTVNGVPSTDTLHLTVNYSTSTAYTITACDSYTWVNNDSTNVYTTSGIYTNSYVNTDGCASVDTLYLTVNYNSNTANTQTACDTLTWNGAHYDTTGVYTYNYNTADGCPSVDTLYLTVNHNSSNSQTESSCSDYTWNNHGNSSTYTTSGTYYSYYTTNEGCPTTDTLYLTVNHAANACYNLVELNDYTWVNHDTTIVCTTSGTYYSHYTTTDGCSGTDTLYLTLYHNGHCPWPQDLVVDALTDQMIGLSWTGHSPAVQWEVEYGPRSFMRGTGTHQVVNTTSCQITGLAASTTYDIYVRSICGEGDTSNYTMRSITTACAPIVQLPYTEDFNSYPSRPPTRIDQCWYTGTSYAIRYPTRVNNPSYNPPATGYSWSLRFPGDANNYSYATLPLFEDSINSLMLSFMMRKADGTNSDNGVVRIGVMTDPTEFSTFQLVQTVSVNSSDWESFDVPLTTYSGSGRYITIASGNTGQGDAYIDNVVVSEAHACLRPQVSSLKAKAILGRSATVSWRQPGGTNLWHVEYGIEGSSSATYRFMSVSAPEANLTGLAPDTTYTVVVRAICGDGDSSEAMSINFRTGCTPLSHAQLPFIEGFQRYGNNMQPTPCWHFGTNQASHRHPRVETRAAIVGSTGLTFLASDTLYSYAAFPEIDGPLQSLQVSFKARRELAASPSNSSHIYVGVMADPEDYSTFIRVADINDHTNTARDYSVMLNRYNGPQGCIAIACADAMIGSATVNYTFIDSIKIESPVCPAPDSLIVSVGDNYADVIWSERGSATRWMLEYGNAGFTRGTGTRIVVNDTSYRITGLSSATQYDIYVVSICSVRDTSPYRFYTFTTSCAEIDSTRVPLLSENFESYALNTTLIPCWHCGYFTPQNGTMTYDASAARPTVANSIGNGGSQGYALMSSNDGTYSYFTLPLFNVDINRLMIAYDCISNAASASPLLIALTPDPFNLANIDTVKVVGLTTQYRRDTAYVHGHSPLKRYIVFISDRARTESGTQLIYLDNIKVELKPSCNGTLYVSDTLTACDSLRWHGDLYTASGTYIQSYVNEAGCPTVANLSLTVDSTGMAYTQNACDTFLWENHGRSYTYTVSGIYHNSYTTQGGCVGADTLHLTVHQGGGNSYNVTTCDSLTWVNHGNTSLHAATGTYYSHYTDANGCNALDVLNLTVNYGIARMDTVTACSSYAWIDGQTYTADNTTATHTLINTEGCDSAITLHLTLYTDSSASFTATAADSYTWVNHGISTTFDTSGTYTNAYTTADGCASTDTLHLTIGYDLGNSDTINACDFYTWHDTNYTASGVYTYNANGHSDTLYLTVNHNSNAGYTIVACDSYTWNNNDSTTFYTTSGTYYRHYMAANGCPSVDTLHLTVIHSSSGTDAVSLSADNYDICNGQTVRLTARGAARYSWNGATMSSDSVKTFRPTTTTTYTVAGEVANSSACRTNDTIVVRVHYYPTLTTSGDTAICFGDTIYLTATGGDLYYWEGGNATTSGSYRIYPSSTHSYSVRATDTAGMCSVTRYLNVTVNQLPMVTLNCPGRAGIGHPVVLTAAGGTSYSWDLGRSYVTSSTHRTTYGTTGLHIFSVIGRDNNGCRAAATCNTDFFDVPSGLTIVASRDTVCEGDSDTVTVSGATYYQWSTDGVNFAPATPDSTLRTMSLVLTQDTVVYVRGFNQTADLSFYGSASVALGVKRYPDNSTSYTVIDTTSYTWVNHDSSYTYTASGIYTNSYTTTGGCTGTDTLYLTIVNYVGGSEVVTACNSYIWHDSTYTASGTYTYEYNSNGHADTLRLTVNYSNTYTDVQDVCDSLVWIDGTTYTASNTTATHTLTNAAGCDSTVTLNLTVRHSSTGSDTLTACRDFVWHGVAYHVSRGDTAAPHFDTLNAAGCDSVITLRLTLYADSGTAFTAADTDSYTWVSHGDTATYAASGTYTHSYTTAHGCAATDTLHLTIISSTPIYFVRAATSNTAMGRASVDGGSNVAAGTSCTIRARANNGYRFVRWNNGITANPYTFTVTQDTIFVAVFERNSYTVAIVNANPDRGTVTGAGTMTVAYGTQHTVTATANYGYRFGHWSDGDTNASRTITVTRNMTLTAYFDIRRFSIAALTSDSTKGTVSGGGNYDYLSYATLQATPANGCRFDRWSDGDTNATRRIQVTADGTFTAYFVAGPRTYTLTVLSGNSAMGTVSGGGTYTAGTQATISATPNSGYEFVMWNDGLTANPRTVTMNGDMTFTATFRQIPAPTSFTVTVASNDAGMGRASGGGTFRRGATTQLNAYPAAHCHFVRWSDGDSRNPRSLVVDRDYSLTAVFARDSVEITVRASNDRMGTVAGGGMYAVGSEATLTATPNRGYRFKKWNTGETTPTITVTVRYAATYTALFNPSTQGIDEAGDAQQHVWSSMATIHVDGLCDETVSVYDVTGRLIGQQRHATGEWTLTVRDQGVYMVQTATGVHKVVTIW